jgi:hypothetical protein
MLQVDVMTGAPAGFYESALCESHTTKTDQVLKQSLRGERSVY